MLRVRSSSNTQQLQAYVRRRHARSVDHPADCRAAARPRCLTELASARHAFRLSPDEWMDALGVNLWDADVRASIEALQWGVAQDLMRLGTSVIIEWDTWGREERAVLRESAPDRWTLPSSCTRSDSRSVGKECVITGRSRGPAVPEKNKK